MKTRKDEAVEAPPLWPGCWGAQEAVHVERATSATALRAEGGLGE